MCEIVELGHEVGSHTCTHQDLTKLSRTRLRYELRESKRFLEDITGKEILGIAYPYGFFNTRVLQEVSRFYYYARSASVYDIEDVYNMRPPSRYIISALTIHHLPRLPMKIFKYGKSVHPVLFAHDVCSFKIISLILFLKALNVEFVTVKELVHHVVRECDI